jgi:D-alanyl-D-alanine carboxypeptidase
VRRALLVAALLAGCTGGPAVDRSALYACAPDGDPGASHPKAVERQALVDAYVRRGYPGVVLLVRDQDGLWVGQGGQADLAGGSPRLACQIQPIASITKTFMAVTTLTLVDEGVIGLDEPIRNWLPADIVANIGNADTATIRQLLANTAGVPNYNESLEFLTDVVDDPRRELASAYDYLDYVRGAPAHFPAGEAHRYSNSNFLLLGMVLDGIAGAHDAAMRERVLAPLGLAHTQYDRARAKPEALVRGYTELQGDGRLVDATDFLFAQQYGSPAGGVHSTVRDLQRFIDAIFREHELLSPASRAAMQAWVPLPEGVRTSYDRYGLGLEEVRTDHGRVIGHSGDKLGYQSFMFYEPDRDVTVVAMVSTDSDSPRFGALTRDFVNELEKLPYR